MTAERIPFKIDTGRVIELLCKQLYQSPLALLRENTQNAYDAVLQRLHLGPTFEPLIEVTIAPEKIVVKDNGIGMMWEELDRNYWKAGSSGKNNDEARAAGVVGTFGIGAMANFGVCSKLRVETRVELKRLQRALDVTAVYVTHDQEEAMSMSDRLAIFMDGRIVQIGTPEEIYGQPATVEVAAFLVIV